MKKALAERPVSLKATLDPREVAEVQRALAELRAGRAVHFKPLSGPTLLVLATEGLDPASLGGVLTGTEAAFRGKARLLLTATRARHLGLAPATGAETLALSAEHLGLAEIAELTDPTRPRQRAVEQLPPVTEPLPSAVAILELLKAARLLPAALVLPGEDKKGVLAVSEGSIRRFRDQAARLLSRVAEAKVPLLDAEETSIVAFRPADGGREHLAIIIGELDASKPVLTRLHSECFTGDLLRSLRCDCGDQLRGAIDAMSHEGAGVLLYLAQEGRGIGLVNKLRAYALQDRGADTLDANEQLGFDADERVYRPAAEMLRQLGIAQVRLLTNNPLKVEALTACNVEVVARVPHSFPANGHNTAYLSTKAQRFGHLL